MTVEVVFDKSHYLPNEPIRMEVHSPQAQIAERGWVDASGPAAVFTSVCNPNARGKLHLTVGTEHISVFRPIGSYTVDETTSGYAHTGVTLKPYPMTGGPAGDIVRGDLILRDPGIVLDGWDIPARILSRSARNRLTRSLVRGNPNITNPGAMVDCFNRNSNDFLIEDVKFLPTKPMPSQNAVFGHDVICRRIDASQVTDGVGAASPTGENNVGIYDSYIHGLAGHAPDFPLNRPFTHNDCVHVHGGKGLEAINNTFLAFYATDVPSRDGTSLSDQLRDSAHKNKLGGFNPYYGKKVGGADYTKNTNAVLQVNERGTFAVDYIVWKHNYVDGGIYCFNLAANLGANSEFSYNRFGRRFARAAGGSGAAAVKNSHNIYADDYTPIRWG